MGDSPACSLESTYHYTHHPLLIHSARPRTGERATTPDQFPTSPSSSSSAAPLQLASHPQGPPHLFVQQPAFLLLRPDLHCPPSHALQSAAYPTVIVSPHYETPAIERESTRPAVKKPFTPSPLARRQLDGNNGAAHGVHSSAPPMTSNGLLNMSGKREEGAPVASHPRPQRPSMVSQHSNSVPSTPLQLARQYESRSRSPSPNGGLGSHSPRSVSSEANGPMPTLRKGALYKCKYETNLAFGRRRIPYVSSDILDKAKEEPKKTLDPHEEEKLSGDMRELYDRLLPTEESTNRRSAFVKKLENILHSEWPGNEFKVHVFGSSGNLLYTSESDVDICIQTPMKRLEEMHPLAEALAKHGMERVVCVPQAKVRIVKVWDPELQLACDMNVNNTLALENTRMIKTYVQIDDRVRPLAMIIKYWTKQRILNDAALGGTISSYTWICMILNFLQTREPPIIPSLHNFPSKKAKGATPESSFADDLDELRGFGKDNKETLGQLLFQFFRRFGHELDYETHVISVRQGRLLTREEKGWDLKNLRKEARNRLCVEEPFNTERNLGNSADDFAWRGIHLEIRRAFDLLADGGQLDKACEQFEFPPEEKVVFKKPTSSVRPVLTQSVPNRGGRGGSSHRPGGRGNYYQKSNHNQRRASSSASFGANRPPFLNSPPIPVMPSQDHFPRGLNEQLHDQLYQQYQILEAQSNSLRAQLAAQQRAQQAHQVQAAHHHAQLVAQVQAAHGRGQSSSGGSPQKSPYVNGRSSPRLPELGLPGTALPQGFLYHYPGFFAPDHAPVPVATDVSRTNPPSPSLTNSVPGLRRGVHRSSNASETGSLRSQSQPPRGLPPQVLLPSYPPIPQQYYDPASFAGYPIARSTQDPSTPQQTPETPYSPMSSYPETAVSSDQGTPKEYVGYYVAEQPHSRPLQNYAVPQIPSFNELASRRKRVSPEITQPLLNTALRRVSRSPSPLGGHVRSYSTSVTPPLGTASQPRNDPTQLHDDGGPVIVNGSFPPQLRESRNRSGTVDTLPSMDAVNPTALGICVPSSDQYRLSATEQRQQLVFDEIQRQKAADLMRATIVNGSGTTTSPTDGSSITRVPSGGKQPFPSLPDAWMNYDSGNGDSNNHSTEVSPTRAQAPQWRASQFANGLTQLDTLNAPRAPPQEVKSAGLPLLSPVFETRTPSPTASRQVEPSKLVNGKSKENHPQPRRASHTAAPSKESAKGTPKGSTQQTEKSGKPGAGHNNAAVWHQKNDKRRNKKGNKASKQGGDAKPSGEPLPANAADRKGG